MNNIIQSLPKLEIRNNFRNSNFINEKGLKLYIPRGKKYIAWFRNVNNQPRCIIIEYKKNNKNNNKYFTNIENKLVSFKEQLTTGIGTILYGTLISNNSFVIEKVIYDKGEFKKHSNIMNHIENARNILSNNINEVNNIRYCMNFYFLEFQNTPELLVPQVHT